MHQTIVQIARPAKRSSQSNARGYVLLSLMLLITLMLIAMSVELPRIAQQIKREKEEELVNRGMDYARAVKRFHHKTNAYPNSIDQLKDTNHVRFLRKEYKDPITGESEWKLVHLNEAEIKIPQGNGPQGLQGSNPGLVGGGNSGPTAQPGGTAGVNPGAAGGSGFSGGSSGFSGGSTGLSGGSSGLSGGSSGLSGGSSGLSGGSTLSGSGTGLTGSTTGQNSGGSGGVTPQSGNTQGGSSLGGSSQGGASQGGSGALQTSGIGLNNTGQTFGGGGIIGFASTSKKNSIKEFNEKNEYDQWYFVYDPRLEQQGPNQIGSANGGLVVAAPRAGSAGQGQATPGGLQGSTAPQPNGQQQPNGQPQPIGQPPSGGAATSSPTPQVPQ